MHYALNLRTFAHSHYFYLGLRVAIGVLGLTFLALELAGTAAAMTVCIGALCTSLMDMPGPLRHKFNEMMAAALPCTLVTLVTLVIVLCGALPGPFKLLVALLTFLVSMMVAYGKKSMPLQLAALFTMTMALQPGTESAIDAALDPAAEGPERPNWQGWPLLERRVRLLQADADRIAVHGNAIRRSVAGLGA